MTYNNRQIRTQLNRLIGAYELWIDGELLTPCTFATKHEAHEFARTLIDDEGN